MTSKQEVLDFIERNEADGTAGRKIQEAALKGYVESDRYDFKMDANEQHRIREYAYRVIAGIWNEKRRDAKLREIYAGVKEKIVADIESGEWPKVWIIPDKRTVDRRVNELAEMHSEYWVFDFTCPPCICLKAGFYRPNPMLYPEGVRQDILSVISDIPTSRNEP